MRSDPFCSTLTRSEHGTITFLSQQFFAKSPRPESVSDRVLRFIDSYGLFSAGRNMGAIMSVNEDGFVNIRRLLVLPLLFYR